MIENWYALFICINKEVSVDKALICMGLNKRVHGKQKNPRKSKYSIEFTREVVKLKDSGKSYKEVGEFFNLNKSQVEGIIRKYKQESATKNPEQSVLSSIQKQSSRLYHMKGEMQVESKH